MKKASWLIISILSIIIGLYPILYILIANEFIELSPESAEIILIDKQFGLFAFKSAELLKDNLWNIAFYGHILFSGLALLIGWLQFSTKLRKKNLGLHKKIGKTYVVSVLLGGFFSLFIALYAIGGVISSLGFFSLGLVWLTTTILGFTTIKKGNVDLHEKYMIFSYAACFAAVTLRFWLPLLTITMNDFYSAYKIVSWLCWVPNIIVAYLIVKNKRTINSNPSAT